MFSGNNSNQETVYNEVKRNPYDTTSARGKATARVPTEAMKNEKWKVKTLHVRSEQQCLITHF